MRATILLLLGIGLAGCVQHPAPPPASAPCNCSRPASGRTVIR